MKKRHQAVKTSKKMNKLNSQKRHEETTPSIKDKLQQKQNQLAATR
jgi:hypothetical protein